MHTTENYTKALTYWFLLDSIITVAQATPDDNLERFLRQVDEKFNVMRGQVNAQVEAVVAQVACNKQEADESFSSLRTEMASAYSQLSKLHESNAQMNSKLDASNAQLNSKLDAILAGMTSPQPKAPEQAYMPYFSFNTPNPHMSPTYPQPHPYPQPYFSSPAGTTVVVNAQEFCAFIYFIYLFF